MQPWLASTFSTMSVAALLAAIGALFKMYSNDIQQRSEYEQLEKRVNNHDDQLRDGDRRLIKIEVMMGRIDENVRRLLNQHDRDDTRGH